MGLLEGATAHAKVTASHPEVVKAIRACVQETGSATRFSASIPVDTSAETMARGKYILSQFGPLAED